jgi:pimeloyl-ACP methyl ester carboxylesterase
MSDSTSASPRGLAKVLLLTRLMVYGDRQPITRTPTDVGLDFERVRFTASDGVELDGWFVPAGQTRGPVVAWVHGWLWNRTGNVAGRVPFVDRDVEFLTATKALHDAGFHVLMFDLANHGHSGARLPLTHGVWEARDVRGAVRYLAGRPDVDPSRIGVIGTSAGGNTAMYAIAGGAQVKALLAIQPTKLSVFNRNFARDVLGPLGPAGAASTNVLYALMRAPLPLRHDPAIPARRLGATVVQYVQGTGDPWGEMGVVEGFSRVTPESLGVIAFPSAGRYEGYQYISAQPDDVVRFFATNL